jgi:RNA polymerase sigma factor (sigma-70 family)
MRIEADGSYMKEYSAGEIIKGIASRRSSIILYVYRSCYPNVRKLILSNSGTELDAQDIFQEGLTKVYQKIAEKGLKLRCEFGTYLYSVCRFLWLKELEKREAIPGTSTDTESLPDNASANNLIRENRELKLYEKHFRELSKECQKVLNMYFRNASMEEICVSMGYKNVQIAKDKKYRCKKTLTGKIYNNPDYKRLQNEIHLAG